MSFYNLSRAELASSYLSSDEDEDRGDEVGARMQYHTAGSDGSLSTERHAMKEQLDTVRNTLNALVIPDQASMSTPPPRASTSGPPASEGRAPAVENLLEDIATRLSNIEGMYTNVTTKLVHVDGRVNSNERTVRELQHISAGAINETARLVDYVGHSMPGNMTPPRLPGSMTPQFAGVSAFGQASRTPQLDYVPGAQVTTTIQQHASQIHKLIAGLDFLEQHIIRQDSVIDSVQQQVMSATKSRSPSEVSLRVHDLSELVSKLRAHLYKVEKKSLAGEVSVQGMSAQLTQLASRMAAVEQTVEKAAVNPLFFDKNGSASLATAGAEGRGPFVTQADFEALQARLAHVLEAPLPALACVPELDQRLSGLEQQLAEAREAAEAAQQEARRVQAEAAELRALLAASDKRAEALGAEVQVLASSVPQPVMDVVESLQEDMQQLTACVSRQAGVEPAQAEGLHALQVQLDALGQELQSGQDGLREEVDQILLEMDRLEQKVEGCMRADQVHTLIFSSQAQSEAAIKEIVQAQAQELSQQLQGLAADARQQAEAAASLREDMDLVFGQQAATRAAMATVSQQVVELADKVAGAAMRPEDVMQLQELALEAKSLAQQNSEEISRAMAECNERVEEVCSGHDRLKEAYANLILDLGDLRVQVVAAASRADASVTQMQLTGVVGTVEELQSSVQEALDGVARLNHDLVTKQQLSNIFAAREDMAKAMEKLEQVFASGSIDKESMPAVEETLTRAGFSTPKMGAALEELGAKQQELAARQQQLQEELGSRQQEVDEQLRQLAARQQELGAGQTEVEEELRTRQQELGGELAARQREMVARQEEMERQIQLLLYRSEQAVKHEQFGSMSQAMIKLELQMKQHQARRPSDSGTQTEQPPQEQGSQLLAGGSGGAIAAADAAAEEFTRVWAEVTRLSAALDAMAQLAHPVGPVGCSTTEQDVARLSGEVMRLSASLDALAARPASTVSPVAPTTAESELARLSGEVAQLHGTVDALQEPVSEFEGKLAELGALKAQLTEAAAVQSEAVAAVMSRQGFLHEEVQRLFALVGQQGSSTSDPQALAVLAQAVASLTKDLQAVQQSMDHHGVALGAIEQLQSQLKRQGATLHELQGRVEQLQQQQQQAAQVPVMNSSSEAQAALQGLQQQVQVLQETIDGHKAELASLKDLPGLLVDSQAAALTGLQALQGQLAQLQQQQQQPGTQDAASSSSLAALAELAGRLQGLEQQVQQQQAPDKALDALALQIQDLEQQVLQLQRQAPYEEGMAALARKIQQLEEQQQQQQGREPSSMASPAPAAISSQPASGSLEAKMAEYGKALQAMRNRVVALQEMIDGTQHTVMELQTEQGSTLVRLRTLETSATPAPPAASASGAAPSGDELAVLKSEVASLQSQLAILMTGSQLGSQALEVATQLGRRVSDAEAKAGDLATQFSGVSQMVPELAVQVKGMERKVHARLKRAFDCLEELMRQLSDIPNIQKPSSKNPFSAIAPAGMNPAVLVLEQRFEVLRTALYQYSKVVADDFRGDAMAHV